MRLSHFKIKNYRSCRDVEIAFSGIHAIVGANNAGKSTILRALDLFFNPTTKKITEESFWNGHTESPIRIEATFSDLNASEKDQFASYLLPGGIIKVARVAVLSDSSISDEEDGTGVKISSEAYKPQPSAVWLREAEITTANISNWWKEKDNLRIRDHDFIAFLNADKQPSVATWKEMAAEFCKQLSPDDFEASWVENPKGYAGVLKGSLPLFILIPAVRDVTEEAKASKSSPFGKLLRTLTEGIGPDKKTEVENVISQLSSRLNRDGKERRLVEIQAEEEKLNSALSKIFVGCDLELEFPTPTFDTLLGAPRIFINDGFRGLVENKGHGLQRSVIFCILQRYADILTTRALQDKRPLILGIEEPELYMHPQAQRTIRRLFCSLAKSGDQVFFTTHSSWLVEVSHFDEIIRVEAQIVSNGSRKLETHVRQLPVHKLIDDLLVRHPKQKGKVTPEAIRQLYSHHYNPNRNEGFFAKKIILVEGQTELYALPLYAECLGYSLDENNISIIECGSKLSMDRFYRIFNELGIPCFLLFDYDFGNQDQDITNFSKELLRLVGLPDSDAPSTKVFDRAAYFEKKWEHTFGSEVPDLPEITTEARKFFGLNPDSGKPLIARFVAKKLVDKGKEAIPSIIREVLENATKITWRESCLRMSVAHDPKPSNPSQDSLDTQKQAGCHAG